MTVGLLALVLSREFAGLLLKLASGMVASTLQGQILNDVGESIAGGGYLICPPHRAVQWLFLGCRFRNRCQVFLTGGLNSQVLPEC